MAAEGKAIYVPGKSVEEMLAAETERRTLISRRTVGLTAEEWNCLDTTIPDIIEILHDVRNVFLDLSYTDDLDKAGVKSILRLAGARCKAWKTRKSTFLIGWTRLFVHRRRQHKMALTRPQTTILQRCRT